MITRCSALPQTTADYLDFEFERVLIRTVRPPAMQM